MGALTWHTTYGRFHDFWNPIQLLGVEVCGALVVPPQKISALQQLVFRCSISLSYETITSRLPPASIKIISVKLSGDFIKFHVHLPVVMENIIWQENWQKLTEISWNEHKWAFSCEISDQLVFNWGIEFCDARPAAKSIAAFQCSEWTVKKRLFPAIIAA